MLVQRDAHIAELGWKDDGSAVVFMAQQTPGLETPLRGSSLGYVTLADKSVTVVWKGKSGMSARGAEICWMGGDIYFTAGAKPDMETSSNTLYSISIKDGTWVRRAGGVSDCVKGVFRAGEKVLVEVLNGLNTDIRDLDGKIIVSEMTTFGAWHAISSTSGHTTLAVAKSSVSCPIEVFPLGHGSSLEQLSSHSETYSADAIEPQVLSVSTFDGDTELDGLFLAPSGDSSKPYPTIVIIHGGPYSRTTAVFMPSYGWVCLTSFFAKSTHKLIVYRHHICYPRDTRSCIPTTAAAAREEKTLLLTVEAESEQLTTTTLSQRLSTVSNAASSTRKT